MLATTVLAKVGTSVAQVVLGWLLLDTDFGVFAAASSIAGFLNLLRDGGTNYLLIQRGVARYERLAGALFWMGMTVSVLSSILLVLAAIPISLYLYKEPNPTVFWIMLVIALSNPINMVGSQLLTKMRGDLRFAEVARINLASALLRQGATIVFAWLGAGPLSFAYPYLVCAAYESLAGYAATRERVWRRKPEPHLWRGLFRHSLWALMGSSTNYLLDYGPYIVGAVLVSPGVLGEFYFAFQITAQLGVLLGFAVQLVLFPIFTRLNDEPERQSSAIVRSLHAMVLAGSAASMAMVVTIEPLERAVWHGKWHPAVLAVMILGLFYQWRISFGLTSAVLHARGRFKRHALLTLVEGVGLMVATLLACLIKPDPAGLAWFTGSWLFIARFGVTAFVLRAHGVSMGAMVEALFPAWVIGAVAAGAALALDRYVAIAGPMQEWLAPRLVSWFHAKDLSRMELIAESVAQVARAGVLFAVFAVVFMGLVRVVLARHVHDAIALAPERLRRPASILLGIR